MKCAILTLFPEAIKPYLDESILGLAQDRGLLNIDYVNFRDYSSDRHRTVDDWPFGGGPGMVLKPEPIFEAVEATEQAHGPFHKILLCPRGQSHTQTKARELATRDRLLFLCGRYEGFDERIREGFEWDEISVGDYVVAGGEIPALLVLESVARLLPGVLGCDRSAEFESFQNGDLVDYPQYTRPREFRGMAAPEILFSGDHQAVDRWRHAQAKSLTQQRKSNTARQNRIDPD